MEPKKITSHILFRFVKTSKFDMYFSRVICEIFSHMTPPFMAMNGKCMDEIDYTYNSFYPLGFSKITRSSRLI